MAVLCPKQIIGRIMLTWPVKNCSCKIQNCILYLILCISMRSINRSTSFAASATGKTRSSCGHLLYHHSNYQPHLRTNSFKINKDQKIIRSNIRHQNDTICFENQGWIFFILPITRNLEKSQPRSSIYVLQTASTATISTISTSWPSAPRQSFPEQNYKIQ